MQTVSRFYAITLDTLLYGNSTISLQANSDMFEAVQPFCKKKNITDSSLSTNTSLKVSLQL